MFYRENGQFKTTYQADQQILPIRQDRLAMLAILVLAFVVVPALADDYFFRAILIPFTIMSLAALGVNILVGYCGQITLGSGAFMAVGAYDGMALLYKALEKTKGNADGTALVDAMKGMSWTSVRGPVSIDANTRDIVQTVYIRKAEASGGAWFNVEFDQVEKVRDPGV